MFTCIVNEYGARKEKFLVGNATFHQKYEEHVAKTEEVNLNAVPMKKTDFEELREELDIFRIKFNQSNPKTTKMTDCFALFEYEQSPETSTSTLLQKSSSKCPTLT